MNAVKICIDPIKFKEKPTTEKKKELSDKRGNPRSEIDLISWRIVNYIDMWSREDLCTAIEAGQTWIPHEYMPDGKWNRRRRKQIFWHSCQAIAVDFDDNVASVDDLFGPIKELGLDWTIVHHSFSSTSEHLKLRGIMFLDEPIYNAEDAYAITYFLVSLFGPMADKSCRDLSRLYFGSRPNSIVYTSDFRGDVGAILSHVSDDIRREIRHKHGAVFEQSGNGFDVVAVSSEELKTITKNEEFHGILQKLHPKYKEIVLTKIREEVDLLSNYRGGFSSRYVLLWNATRALAQFSFLPTDIIFRYIVGAVRSNSYFSNWDKSIENTVCTAIAWGRKFPYK